MLVVLVVLVVLALPSTSESDLYITFHYEFMSADLPQPAKEIHGVVVGTEPRAELI